MKNSLFNEKLNYFKGILGKSIPNMDRVFNEWKEVYKENNGTIVCHSGETYIPSFEAFYIVECAYVARRYFNIETDIYGADDLNEIEYVK